MKKHRIKKLFLHVPLIFGALCIAGCASDQQTSTAANKTLIELDEQNRLVLRGRIDSEAAERVLSIYDEATEKPEVLFISSGGGAIEAGLDLAEWLLDHEMHVEVGNICFSSCANYLFLAGRTKRVSEHSIVGWHGSAWQKRYYDDRADSESEKYDPAFEVLRQREVDFFSRIGVDNLITVYGQDVPLKLRHWLRYLTGRGRLEGFDYNLADLNRFGVNDIVLLDGTWNWRAHHEGFAPSVRRLALDADYEFRLNRFGPQEDTPD